MNTFIKLILFQVALLAFQSAVYFGVQKLEGPAHDVSGRLDKRIPFIPQTIYLYGMWYPLIAIFPIGLYYAQPEAYVHYMAAVIIDIVVSAIIYLLYPTSFERPEPPRDILSGKILKWVYDKGNYTGKNCMPSMHCSMCFIIMIFAVCCNDMNLSIRVISCTVAMLITASTILTKQHVVIDMITAAPLAAGCYIISAAVL